MPANTCRLTELAGREGISHALQDKVWVHGPGQKPWEIHTVKDDSVTFGQDSTATLTPATCCTPDATTGDIDKTTQPADADLARGMHYPT
jgi:uncharacterized Rossmann fold enzyme